MKFPWTRRAEEAQREREQAEQQLKKAEDDWPRVNAQVEVTQIESTSPDGWTATVAHIFGGH